MKWWREISYFRHLKHLYYFCRLHLQSICLQKQCYKNYLCTYSGLILSLLGFLVMLIIHHAIYFAVLLQNFLAIPNCFYTHSCMFLVSKQDISHAFTLLLMTWLDMQLCNWKFVMLIGHLFPDPVSIPLSFLSYWQIGFSNLPCCC